MPGSAFAPVLDDGHAAFPVRVTVRAKISERKVQP